MAWAKKHKNPCLKSVRKLAQNQMYLSAVIANLLLHVLAHEAPNKKRGVVSLYTPTFHLKSLFLVLTNPSTISDTVGEKSISNIPPIIRT